MTVRDLFNADLVLLGSATQSKNAATTTAFDFGTPNDINLATAYPHDGRLLVVLSGTTAGITDTLSFSVQDADDNAGSFGTAAPASTDGTLTGGKTTVFAHTTVQVKAGRPWLRVNATSSGATDTFACTCQVFALKRGA